MAKKKEIEHIWVVAYIDSDQVDKVQEQLDKYEDYDNIKAYIPTVKILKKTFKQKNEFQNVPLLFNYGFFRVPITYLRNPEFFTTLRDRLPVIYQWVKDNSASRILRHRFKLKDPEEEAERPKQYVKIAIASEEEIKRLEIEASKTIIYDCSDLHNLQAGCHITLMGYPWQDMEAKIISIDHKKQEVKVELIIESYTKEATVSFHNVFYSIYRGDHRIEPIREKSIEELKFKGRKIVDNSQPEIEI